MTVDEAAKLLEVSPSLVYRLCRAGKLGHVRIGMKRGVVRISEADVAAFRERNRADAAGEEGPRVVKVRGKAVVIPDSFARLKRIRAEEKAARKGGG